MITQFVPNISDKSIVSKNHDVYGAREMAQQSEALAALAEDLGWIPSIHMVAHNHLWFQFQGI